MNREQAIAALKANDGQPIRVATKGGTQYWLCLDVVECATEEYVYGTFVKPNPRRRCDYRWFYLKSVEVVA